MLGKWLVEKGGFVKGGVPENEGRVVGVLKHVQDIKTRLAQRKRASALQAAVREGVIAGRSCYSHTLLTYLFYDTKHLEK